MPAESLTMPALFVLTTTNKRDKEKRHEQAIK